YARARCRQFPASCPTLYLGGSQRLFQLRVFDTRGGQDVRQFNVGFFLRRKEGSMHRDVADYAARHVELGQALEIQVSERCLAWEDPLPDLRTRAHVRKRKLQNEADPPQESWIQRVLHVCG